MFGRSGKKSKRTSKNSREKHPSHGGVLSTQKPQRQRRKIKNWKIGACIGLLVLIIVGIMYVTRPSIPQKIAANYKNKLPVEIIIHPDMRDDEHLSDATRNDIAQAGGKLITDMQEETLARAARALQSKFLADSVHLVRVAPNRISLLLKPRTPIMRVKGESIRLLSQLGHVYGTARDDHASLPLLSGLIDTNNVARMRDNNTLLLSAEQEVIAKEALELLALLSQTTLRDSFDEIRFVKFRGITLRSSHDDLEVTIGRSPFDRKVDGLNRILAGLKKKGSQAQRIELDYDGKAFIKEKRL